MSGEPSYAYRPDFTPSPVPCFASNYNEVRARLYAGNTFFRSYAPGVLSNNITVEAVWEYFDTIENEYLSTTDVELMERVRLIVRDSFGTIQEFIQLQSYQFTARGGICDDYISAIPGIRAQVNSVPDNQKIIQMPNRNGQCAFNSYEDVVDQSSGSIDGAFLNYFPETNLINGSGPPIDETSLAAIRTGPYRTIAIIAASEFNDTHPIKGDGSLILPSTDRRVLQWDGSQWISYVPFT